mgnify:CR=1 FL=1
MPEATIVSVVPETVQVPDVSDASPTVRPEDAVAEANSLYDKLESAILPLYYGQPNAYASVMRYAISLNGSFFNTQRMVRQYLTNAYFPEGELQF